MREPESGKDRVQKICEILRKETLEPAKVKAEQILIDAETQATQIVEKAHQEAREILERNKKEIARERTIFQSSLGQACKQVLQKLEQSIEKEFFDKNLLHWVSQASVDPTALSGLITAVVKAIDREGIVGDVSVYIPDLVSVDAVNRLLAHSVLERLKENTVLIGTFAGGIEVKLKEKNITLDIRSEVLKDLVAHYLHSDFRSVLYQEETVRDKKDPSKKDAL